MTKKSGWYLVCTRGNYHRMALFDELKEGTRERFNLYEAGVYMVPSFAQLVSKYELVEQCQSFLFVPSFTIVDLFMWRSNNPHRIPVHLVNRSGQYKFIQTIDDAFDEICIQNGSGARNPKIVVNDIGKSVMAYLEERYGSFRLLNRK